MLDIIKRLVDKSEFDEYKKGFGQSILCGHARIDGWAVGIVANERQVVKSKKGEMKFGGVIYSDAEEVLSDFCKTSGIPIVETQAGKGSLSWDHDQNLGAVGVTGTSAANLIAQKSDLVICIGTRLSDFTTASKTLFKKGFWLYRQTHG